MEYFKKYILKTLLLIVLFLLLLVIINLIIAYCYLVFYYRNISFNNFKLIIKQPKILIITFCVTLLLFILFTSLIFLHNQQSKNCLIYKKVKNKKLILLNQSFGLIRNKLNQHTLLIGATGNGKTNTIIKIIQELLKSKQKIIIIDGKGDKDLIEIIKKQTNNFYLWQIDGKNFYNPFNNKNSVIIADKLMSLFAFSEPHYQTIANNYLIILVKGLLNNGIVITLENIIKYFPTKNLKKLYASDDFNYEYLSYFKSSEINELMHRIQNYYQTLQTSISINNSLSEILNQNQIILFSLDSLTYPLLASKVGKLIVEDLKSFAVVKDKALKVNLIFDEFNVFASDNIINLINKTRSFNYQCFLSFQTISDLKVNNCDLTNLIFANSANIIVHNIKDPVTNDYLIKVFSTKLVKQFNNNKQNYDYQIKENSVLKNYDLLSLKLGEVYCKVNWINNQVIIKKNKN